MKKFFKRSVYLFMPGLLQFGAAMSGMSLSREDVGGAPGGIGRRQP